MTGIERLRDIAEDRYSGGMVHISVHKLREICEQIEREAGVETVKADAMCKPLLGIDGSPIVPGEVYYGQSDGKRWRIDAVGTLFAWAGLSKTARMRGEGPKRLRPEWLSRKPTAPKVLDADGVEIRAGDHVWNECGTAFTVIAVNGKNKSFKAMRHYDRQECDGCNPSIFTHRAPVLASDGKPLEVGQTVWSANGDELIVGAIEDGGHTVTCRYADVGDGIPVHGMWSPSDLAHKRPVLDADGAPIHEGDTVYGTVEGGPFIVTEVSGKGSVFVDAFPDTGMHGSMLTHTKPEPPDTWERIEKDKDLNPFDYCKKVGHKLWTFENAEEFKARDLVRRCKALAGVTE